ncbi:MAG TPA: peptidase M3, partial [Bdellovibrionota bacterium]|nr:peptidase M3 [Bdellovibrionota bacterium]
MAKTLEDFNREYLSVHTKKENLFWTTYMGVEKDGSLLEKAETEFKSYISDPKHLAAVREAQQAKDLSPETRAALKGWLAFFDSHAIESESARTLQKELIELESAIFQKRAKLQLFYKNKDGQDTQGSTNVLSTNLAASDNENVRKTSHEALLRLEQWVL